MNRHNLTKAVAIQNRDLFSREEENDIQGINKSSMLGNR